MKISERALASRRRRGSRAKKRRRIRRYIVEYGQEFADLYKSVCDIIPKHAKRRFLELKLSFFHKKYGLNLEVKAMKRIELMNKVAGLSLVNVGWNCMACGAFHIVPWFFDLDHIIPKKHKGTDKLGNFQILCPSCHKKKTLQIDGFSETQNFKVKNEPMTKWENQTHWHGTD